MIFKELGYQKRMNINILKGIFFENFDFFVQMGGFCWFVYSVYIYNVYT